MKDPKDTKTAELLPTLTKAQRFRAKQIAEGRRQYAYWLTENEARILKDYIERMREVA